MYVSFIEFFTIYSVYPQVLQNALSVDNLTYYQKGIDLAATEPGPLVLKCSRNVEILWSGLLISKT